MLEWNPREEAWRQVGENRSEAAGVNAFLRNDQGWMFAGTNRGVLVSYDDGDTWTASSAGLPDGPVLSLALDAAGNLYAGTNEGVFQTPLTKASP